MNDPYYQIGTRAGKGRYIVNDDELNELVDGLSKIKNKSEMKNLLHDLLTIREMAEIIRRWLAGRMIMNGKTYEEIIDRTGMAEGTISEISNRLLNGSGTFFKILERTSHHATQLERIATIKQKRELDASRSPTDRKFRKRIPFLD